MRDPELIFGYIDRTLHECDARQLPPLVPPPPPEVIPAELGLAEPKRRRRFRWPWSRP